MRLQLRFWVGLAAVVLVAAGSVVAALVVRSNEVDRFHQMQQDEALRAARQAEAVGQLSVGHLASIAAFFQADRRIGAHQFEVVGRSLLHRGALSATVFLERVPDSERATYERRHFPILDRGALGKPRPAARRSVYYPVTFAVSKEAGEAPLGYDVGHDPLRGSALARARDAGRSAATGVMPLLIGGLGINVFQPIYRDRAPTATVAERRRALVGFAGGAFRIGDLAAPAVAAVPKSATVQIRVNGTPVSGPGEQLEDAAAAPVRIADQTWSLVVRDGNRPGVGLPLMMGVVGVSLALLLGALILIWSHNERMQELQRLADHDPLTGLRNRRRFEEDLKGEIARARRSGSLGALLMLDLDNFKQVNDNLGHGVGDRMIEQIAAVLQGRTRETDVLARVGGDEFAIVLPDIHRPDEARAVAEEITAGLREHVQQPEGIAPVTLSVGVALFGADTEATFDSVQSDADAAMYAAKREGRNRVRLAN